MELAAEHYKFGEWIYIDGDEFNQGQIVDYDILNDAYCIDKNGKWEWYNSDKIQKLDL